jgi:hypothetical protein
MMEGGLKVGDPVKIIERDAAGNNRKTVEIAKHSGGGVKHGDADRVTAADRDVNRDADVTYGRVKEFTNSRRIVIDVDNAIDKNYDLTDTNVKYMLEGGLKVGDPVKIMERDAAGNNRKSVEISKHSGGGVKHGDADRQKQN